MKPTHVDAHVSHKLGVVNTIEDHRATWTCSRGRSHYLFILSANQGDAGIGLILVPQQGELRAHTRAENMPHFACRVLAGRWAGVTGDRGGDLVWG